ncbi:MAG: hypothetical protein ILA03_07570 [Bacteroidaceae bacterium]|nr:hypothetical protein [Bacteroidaceae bacterium]
MNEDFKLDYIFGERLLISTRADQTELLDNIRAARILLSYFNDMYIRINEHLMTIGHKNPEYTINGKLADRKGLESEDGIKSAFRKAKIQGCQTIVLDFDMHMADMPLRTRKIANGLFGRHEDFMNNCISECYVIHQNKAILITSDLFFDENKYMVKNKLITLLEKIRDIT